jgi:hypothetical protein
MGNACYNYDVMNQPFEIQLSVFMYSECCDIAGYHWDCSDWVNRSQNPLPNITEVPGSEVPDSSSFHSNESNESNTHQGNMTLPLGKYSAHIFQQEILGETCDTHFLEMLQSV